jgi:hypothetical protein
MDPRASIMGVEGFGHLKNPIISLGMKLATFRLVAQCLKDYNQSPYVRAQQICVCIYFSAFHGTRRFNTEFTRALHLFLS